MTPSSKPAYPMLTQVALRKIATALNSHLSAHVSSSHPSGIVLQHISALRKRGRTKDRFMVSTVLPVYVAQLHQLARAGVSSLKIMGLLLLVRSPTQEDLLVEVTDVDQTIRVMSGTIAEELVRSLENVTGGSRHKQDTMRVLRVPALHLYAVWLDSPSNSTGVFVPFTPNHARVVPGRRYSLARFNAQLKTTAMRLILNWYERSITEPRDKKSAPVKPTKLPRRSSGAPSRDGRRMTTRS